MLGGRDDHKLSEVMLFQRPDDAFFFAFFSASSSKAKLDCTLKNIADFWTQIISFWACQGRAVFYIGLRTRNWRLMQ